MRLRWVLLLLLLPMPASAAFILPDPTQGVQPTLFWSVDTVCQTFYDNLLAERGQWDGSCDPNDILPEWYHPTFDPLFYDSVYQGNRHTPPGVQLAPGFAGQVMRQRFTNMGDTVHFGRWQHLAPQGWPTCPLTIDETLCVPVEACIDVDEDGLCDASGKPQQGIVGECGSVAITYTNINQGAGVTTREWRSFGPLQANDAIPQNSHIAERAWKGTLAWEFPAALYVVGGYNITMRLHYPTDVGYQYHYGSFGGSNLGTDKHLTVSAYGCTGVAAGGPAILVDSADVFTGHGGQLDGNCVEYDTERATFQSIAAATCWIGLGDGVTPIEGIVAESIDGAAVTQQDMRTYNQIPSGAVALGPPPTSLPPGTSVEGGWADGLDRFDAGCLDIEGTQLLALNPQYPTCLYDTMHVLAVDAALPGLGKTHHGDGTQGWRHPGTPHEVVTPGLSVRASGVEGHTYPTTFIPEPGIGLGLLAGAALLWRMRR